MPIKCFSQHFKRIIPEIHHLLVLTLVFQLKCIVCKTRLIKFQKFFPEHNHLKTIKNAKKREHGGSCSFDFWTTRQGQSEFKKFKPKIFGWVTKFQLCCKNSLCKMLKNNFSKFHKQNLSKKFPRIFLDRIFLDQSFVDLNVLTGSNLRSDGKNSICRITTRWAVRS